ncbi:HutD/Ves family protein [Xanthomonas nasturtii]|uniref:HutD/Ves family protein n=1 Tax=Xanthomonas nasturtii TaxID=1843581 RepID=UPI0020118BB0|nr:HutD family protein [Xanthomonas nasturtii]MCL1498717.1 HutD family protein [Xanthomonas nasturtii]MCL1502173.1 HutD family protein [Xanthomonas nasturtii]MCL1522600.1 HutD family protein [Xanthomonas nasturtii]MCL1525437.1 HutD family protein [Xanthomonas nasturtii]MCL1534307.1 HutD family protein [Xanthomonas nasturtii]
MQLTDLSSRVIPANEYRRERWRNQLGWTREILRLGDADGWSLRLSIAEIEHDALFSAFPGIDRELVLLQGNGMRLRFGGGNGNAGSGPAGGERDVTDVSVYASNSTSNANLDDSADAHSDADISVASGGRIAELLPPYQRVRFAGEDAVHATLLDGPTQDFNLMWRRDLLQTELLHRPLVGTMLFFADPGSAWAIHLLAGQASFGRDSALPPLVAGDTAWLSAAARTRYVLDGGGELLAIRVSPLAGIEPAGHRAD